MGLVGTPMYLSPEAVANQPPDASFDLWSLAMVLYESIAGSNPMRRSNLRETLDCISQAAVPDLRELVPECRWRPVFSMRSLETVQGGQRAQANSRAGSDEP